MLLSQIRNFAGIGSLVRLMASKDDPNYDTLWQLHQIWALGQFKRAPGPRAKDLISAMESKNREVRVQIAKVLGDIGRSNVDEVSQARREVLIKSLKDSSPKVRFFSAISLGKCGDASAVKPLLEMLRENADNDPYLRHAAVMGLAGIGDINALINASDDLSKSARLGILLALRRMKYVAVGNFLRDTEPALITEAARAIHDELIEPAMPELAKLTTQIGLPDAAIHRALNANFRLGAAENAEAVAALGAYPRASEVMRIEAIEMLAAWAKPSGRDRVLGLWRPIVGRISNPSEKTGKQSEKPTTGRIENPSYEAIAAAAAKKHLPGFFAGPAKVRQAAAKLASAPEAW